MKDQFFKPVESPSVIVTLSNCDVELNRDITGLIHIMMKPVGLGFVIDYPWREEDLRVMLSAWLAGLKGHEGNGQPTETET